MSVSREKRDVPVDPGIRPAINGSVDRSWVRAPDPAGYVFEFVSRRRD
jgi:hypothetical protein